MKGFVSKCCGAPVKIDGSGEGTHWFACTGCGKATDPIFFKKFKQKTASQPEIAEAR